MFGNNRQLTFDILQKAKTAQKMTRNSQICVAYGASEVCVLNEADFERFMIDAGHIRLVFEYKVATAGRVVQKGAEQ